MKNVYFVTSVSEGQGLQMEKPSDRINDSS